ncbi:hypothetical protein BDN71DRAFT_1454723 [Pleurotus eryngii]|uniref:Uncharacterized protein n=1 Tax=Pleurotus eryngii TaxID=5323 RepID=A0A9P5ZKZ7_PLEER|nr:hypothetical protein BDN71DRAFT_1454723 [Pleurotus eryngii]
MVLKHYDTETKITTGYSCHIEGVEVDFNDSWCPGATISLYERAWWPSAWRKLLYTMIDCPKNFHWTPPASQPQLLQNGVEIEYLQDDDTFPEMLVTWEEADERASRAVYDGCYRARIKATRTLSVGTSTVWLKAERVKTSVSACASARLIDVEFATTRWR